MRVICKGGLLHSLPVDITQTNTGVRARFELDGEVVRDRLLFLSRCGAHLHGTATPESDLDLVGVYMEPLSRIVTGEATDRVRASTGERESRNASDDVDVVLVELRTAVEKMLANEPKWVELLHANEQNVALTTDVFDDLRSNSERLHSDDVEPFISYARSQANKYEKRGERLDYVNQFMDVINQYDDETRLSEFVEELPDGHKSIERTETDEGLKRLRAFNREFDWNAPVRLIRESLRSVKSDYGERVSDVGANDRKSLSHAYRLAYEAREYQRTGELSFPLEQADRLRRIKNGEIDFDEARSGVQTAIDRAVDTESVLSDEPDEEFARDWIIRMYGRHADDLTGE